MRKRLAPRAIKPAPRLPSEPESPQEAEPASPSSGRVRDADRTRRLILEAAEELFSRRGLSGVRLREIAERANVTVPLLCHHFRNKETLYQAVIDRALGRLADLGGELMQRPGTMRERIGMMVARLCDLLTSDPRGFAVLHQDLAEGGGRARPVAEKWLLPLFETGIRELTEAQARGELRKELDPEALLLHIVSAVLYPAIAAPVVRVLWNRSLSEAEWNEYHKRELLALLDVLFSS